MKNLYLLATDKPSRLFLNKINNKLLLDSDTYSDLKKILPSSNYQNLYITSDEQIKEGDWFYNTISLKPQPFKACENGDEYVNCSKYSHYRIDCKKIILTTDKDLIDDGIQAIDEDFLQWFVKNANESGVPFDLCEVEKWTDYKLENGNEIPFFNYKIIIPQEQPKQETLEEAIKREYEVRKYNSDFPFEPQSFKLGAKWRAERMYGEEDMRKAFSIGHKCARQGSYNDITEQQDFNKWKEEGYPINFEQYKIQEVKESTKVDKEETWECYEINVVQARMYGCKSQCKECNAEQFKKQEALDLDELESKLDVALNKETSESLTEWIETKRNNIKSVEWLIETLSNKHIGFEMYVNSNKEIIEQANGMNQQEIVTAYQEGTKDNFNSPHFGSGLNYFKETYKK